MSKQTGTLIKEARTAAGMTQKELAEKVDGLSAYALSKAERGEKELTPELLKAIADATGTDPEALMAKAPETAAITDSEFADLFKAADPESQKAAISILKGEKPQGGDMMSMFAGMMGGAGGNAEGGENAEGGDAAANPMAGMMSMFGGMMGGAGGENKENSESTAEEDSEQK